MGRQFLHLTSIYIIKYSYGWKNLVFGKHFYVCSCWNNFPYCLKFQEIFSDKKNSEIFKIFYISLHILVIITIDFKCLGQKFYSELIF